MVPTARLELAQLSPLPPQDSVSTNFTTSARVLQIILMGTFLKNCVEVLRSFSQRESVARRGQFQPLCAVKITLLGAPLVHLEQPHQESLPQVQRAHLEQNCLA